MNHRIILVVVVFIFHSQTCSAKSKGHVSKYKLQQYPDRKKSVLTDFSSSVVIGSALGGAFGPIGAGIGAVVGIFACSLFCSNDPPAPSPPPSIKCFPPSELMHEASEGKTTAVVSWTKAVSSDGEVALLSGKVSGSDFEKGDHTIFYVATRDGYSTTCSFTFTVNVLECETPTNPDFGSFRCDSYPPIFGHTCSFECIDGYEAIGESQQKCKKNKKFRGETFSCQMKTCSTPTEPENTEFDATSDCTEFFDYRSLCHFPCASGYKRQTGDDSFILCRENGQWEPSRASDCVDAAPPELHHCPDSLLAYVGPDQVHTVIDYTPPTANDTEDGAVEMTLIEGPAPGAVLTINRTTWDPAANLHRVTYTAVDSGGLEALRPCSFIVSVVELMCPPLKNFPKLSVTCTEPLYVYGGSCHFSCFSGYPLEGNETVYCDKHEDRDEAFWNWGVGNKPTKCSVEDCPDLDPPQNGAIGCVPISSGKHCAMSCQKDWDIPRTVNTLGTFVCDDAAGWLDGEIVPDCTVIRLGTSYKLPVEFYFSEECTSEVAQDKIKEHVLLATLSSQFSSRCENSDDCTIENVEVRCGNVSQKRAIADIVVRFDFLYRFEFQYDVDPQNQFDEMQDHVYDMFDIFAAEFESGLMDIDELNLTSQRYSLAAGYDDLVCPTGMKPKYNTLSCSSCPTGTMFSETIDDCMKCPVGTYQDQDGQLSCVPCPGGFSTAFNGSRSFENCTGMCEPGTISQNGLIPCYLCGVGTYQDEIGQTNCIPCPEGTNSTAQGSNSLLNCRSGVDVCSDDHLCGNHGVCVPDFDFEDQYTCACADDYSGSNCSVPPDPCNNHGCQFDSICEPLVDDYTCTCQSGYTGRYCELQIVDGGWNSHEMWSDCTKTCGSGNQTRTRHCNNPSPQNGGSDCEGDSVEIRECAQAECPACDTPLRPYGGNIDVAEVNGTMIAELSCDPGKVLSNPNLNIMTCSPASAYQWNPTVDRRNYPKCTAIATADVASLQTEFQYIQVTVNENTEVFETPTTNLLGDSPCVQDNTCELSVTAEVASGSLKKRDTTVTVVVYVTVSTSFSYEPFIQDGNFQEEIANSTLPEYIPVINELESLGLLLQNASSDGSLRVAIGGVTYYPDPDSFVIDGVLSCPDGMHTLTGFCVNCPPGSKEVDGRCISCEVGTYQELEGQIDCLACPEGQTTQFTGSDGQGLCILEVILSTDKWLPDSTGNENKSHQSEPGARTTAAHDSTNSEQNGAGGMDKLVFLAIPGTIVILLIVILALVYICYIQTKRKVEPLPTSFKNPINDAAKKYQRESGGDVILSAPPATYSLNRPNSVRYGSNLFN